MSDESSKGDLKENQGRDYFRKRQIDELCRPYKNELQEYMDPGNRNWREDHKGDIWGGWKFHLNVEPHNVREVSKFLKEQGFNHKFLLGGEVDSGKIFTLKTGSKEMTEKGVRFISDNLGHLLATPKAVGEAPFAPNIVGRFEGSRAEYANKVCKDGIVLALEKAGYRGGKFLIRDEDIEYSRRKLLNTYGDYFGGKIKYYDPTKN